MSLIRNMPTRFCYLHFFLKCLKMTSGFFFVSYFSNNFCFCLNEKVLLKINRYVHSIINRDGYSDVTLKQILFQRTNKIPSLYKFIDFLLTSWTGGKYSQITAKTLHINAEDHFFHNFYFLLHIQHLKTLNYFL